LIRKPKSPNLAVKKFLTVRPTSQDIMNNSASKLPLLDTDVLKTFVAIAECGSFTRAAALVHRTPAALSMQIKRLEETIGKPVFLREPRQVRLTNDGEILLGYSRRLLKLNEEAVQQFLSPSITGKIGFGTTDDIGTRVLPSVLAQFARSFPGVQVDVTITSSREILDRLDSGSLDMALVIMGNEGQEVRGEVIHSEPLVWAGRDGGIAYQQSPLPLALANQGCIWRRAALDALDNAGWAYRVAYTCENTAAQEAAMLADLAITPFPVSLIRSPLRKLEKEGLPELEKYQISLVRNASTPEINALSEHIKSAFLDIRPATTHLPG